ncbi:MAG: hypothetical protein GX591_03740 [Planctomycetes bacterium]|nr:hypothetical protein [Planctomycetota bacterium]
MGIGGIGRVSDQMRMSLTLNSIRANQLQSGLVQQQLATGDRLLTASNDPDAANQAMSLQRRLGLSAQVLENLKTATVVFNQTDEALGNAGDLLTQATVLASDSIDATASERESNAQMIQSIIDALVGIANLRVGDTYVFAGTACLSPAFGADANGVRYLGNDSARAADLGGVGRTPVGLVGSEVFGLAGRGVTGWRDLTPAMTAESRLGSLAGAAGAGIRLDAITVSDGTDTWRVDLTGCDRVGDVIDAIGAATGGAVAASIGPDGRCLHLAGAPGANLTVGEAGSGWAAHDLGLFAPTGQGDSFTGQSVRPRITATTALADLAGGAGADLASGIVITNGGAAATLTFDADATVGDLLNRINAAGLGVEARINADGTGLDVLNQVAGAQLRIGENGGTTAEDLGIRSLHGGTALADLNDGTGVHCTQDRTDLRITARDGTSFEVDLSGAVTLDDVVAAINGAATAAGVAVAAAIRMSGNGLELTDATGGAGTLSAISINNATAAADLGIAQAVSAATLTGEDVNPVSAGGVFTHLAQLRDAMLSGDTAEITRIAQEVEQDGEDLLRIRGRMGGLVQDVQARATRADDLNTDYLSMLSDLKDTDFAEAVTRFQALQLALQANLMTSSSMLNLSLLDFLR